MNLPHPPGSHGQEPPNGGQTGGGAQQPWSQYPGGPTLPPPAGPPPWGPHQQWANGPTPPPNGGSKAKWILGGLSVVLAIALAAVVTVLIIRPDGESRAADDDSGASSSEFASANDTGPVAVLTEDPSCAAQGPILETFAAQQPKGWVERDPAALPSTWAPELREQYEQVAHAMRSAADQIVPLAKLTTHRTMRELYEQFIAYSRAYADQIPTYRPDDDHLARVSITAADAISRICAAVNYGSAAARGPLVPPGESPIDTAAVQSPGDPERFLTEPNAICADWNAALLQFQDDTSAWLETDPDIPGSQWSVEQRKINKEVGPVMERLARRLNDLGEQSGLPTLQDLAALSAQYRLAYVKALPTYTPADKYLASTSIRLAAMINSACKAIS